MAGCHCPPPAHTTVGPTPGDSHMDFIDFFNNSPMMQDAFEQFEYMTGLDRSMYWPIFGGIILLSFVLSVVLPFI